MTTTLIDPQTDVDEDVRRHRPRDEYERRVELARLWRSYASHSKTLAQLEDTQFDANLHLARASVRELAADMISRHGTTLAEAAAAMTHRAQQRAVRGDPPLIDFDQAALSYTCARIWQLCAQEIDPEQPVVQRRWP